MLPCFIPRIRALTLIYYLRFVSYFESGIRVLVYKLRFNYLKSIAACSYASINHCLPSLSTGQLFGVLGCLVNIDNNHKQN